MMGARSLVAGILALALSAGCSGRPPRVAETSSLAELRSSAHSSNPETLGHWLLAEMFSPGGTGDGATRARAALDKSQGQGLYASFARAVFDEAHGQPESASRAYVATLMAARTSDDPDVALMAWVSTRHLFGLRGAARSLFTRYREQLSSLIERPGRIGWRAASDLRDWMVADAFDRAEATGAAYDSLVTRTLGCTRGVRLAGPFGRHVAPDRYRSFPAEAPGIWPPAWDPDPIRGSTPRVLRTEQPRCIATAAERTEDGIFYAESFVTLPQDSDALIVAQGALRVWVDDVSVFERGPRDWGSWHREAAAVRLRAGRHRIVARLPNDTTSLRVLRLDGSPLALTSDGDPSLGYSLARPTLLADPNPLSPWIAPKRVPSPVLAAIAAECAHTLGLDDVASALIEPFAEVKDGAPLTLSLAGIYARQDAALPNDQRRRVERSFHGRANALDAGIWYSAAWLALDDADKRGDVEAIEPLRKLVERFPQQPELGESLARLYGKLGWRAERLRTLVDLSARFPENVAILRAAMAAYDEDGPVAEGDKLAARIERLDPDAEVALDRAIVRHDWKAALRELRKLEKRRPDRKDIASRMADVLERSGNVAAAATQLEKALARHPDNTGLRLRLADRAYAAGDKNALARALADALENGAKSGELRQAIDLLEGASHLEPYRIDGRKVIREYEAWMKQGHQMEGTAARVLDYSTLWVHPDGSSDMLEHEIMRIQSQEAIAKESEQAPPTGLVLAMRVIKADGRVFEPEPVAGKPTLTLPHLEVGDYVDIEHISPQGGDGQRGRRYRGPHWFFREADKGYWRSEFIALLPEDRPTEIETRGQVPPPRTRKVGTFVEHRWRIDESPRAPEEPDAPPPTEFLPSVRVGWGVSLEELVTRLADNAVDDTPLDPRLRKLALDIVAEAKDPEERARRAYRHLATQIEDGNETDGRRVLLGRSGSRQAAFQYLMRLLDVPVDLCLVKNRLAMPPLGKMSEVEGYDALLVRIRTKGGARFLAVRDKFTPFAYVPAEQRGQPAIVLVPGTPRIEIPNEGSQDGVHVQGRANVREDGSASLELSQSYSGKVAIAMRNVLDKIPSSQLHDFVESRLLARNVPGARLKEVHIENQADLSLPVTLRIVADAPDLARRQDAGRVRIRPIYTVRLGQLASLPARQTPLLLGSASFLKLDLDVVVPESWHMPPSLPTLEARDGDRVVRIRDAVHGHALRLDRTIDVPAGRVKPGDEYARFMRFVQDADALLDREVVLGR